MAEEFSVEAILLRLQTKVEHQGESLIALAEQTSGIRDDISHMDETLSAATRTMSDIHTRYITRDEVKEISERRDKERDDAAGKIEAIKGRVDKLSGWRNWLTGVLVTLMAIGYTAFDYLHQWISGGGKP